MNWRGGANSGLSRRRQERDVASGNLKFFDVKKGYGFITQQGAGKDVFIHAKTLSQAGIDGEKLERGTTLSFDVEDGARGAKAVNVRLAA